MTIRQTLEKNKLLMLSLVVGVTSGLASVLLTFLINGIKRLVDSRFNLAENSLPYLVLPGMGMLIALLIVRYLVKDNIGHGVTKVLLAVSRNDSKIKPHNVWSSLLTSSVTIGLGGSVGAEAPIVYTGAAIGSNLGRLCNLSYRDITILLGCGAAGAVSGIFKAPLAGVLFTVEILLFNVSMVSMLPMLLSTVSAAMVSWLILGQAPVFACATVPFSMGNVPFYLIMGVVMGFSSLYFTNGTLWLEDKLGKISNVYLKWLFCAIALGVLIFIFPPLYGEGYGSVLDLLNGRSLKVEDVYLLSRIVSNPWFVPLFFLLVFMMKVPAMTLTNSGGGVGGTFGPTLFSGAMMGFVVARSLNLIGASVPESNFVLVGMAALMAGVMQAPLTAIFLIAEISGGYDLFIPLIITSTVSFGTVRLFEKYSIYTKRIAQSGDLLTHDSDQAVVTLLRTSDLVRDKYPRVKLNDSLGAYVEAISGNDAAVVAVLDDDGIFQGMVDVANTRKYILNKEEYDSLHVYNFMEEAPAMVGIDEKMEDVLAKFDKTGAWRLPVLDAEGHYVGFISKSRILMAYRSELKEISCGDL